ncbi:hypothetical protein AAV35_013600 [Salimicrobium jeotgali]|uniref:Uncharacterized protein n=1 Tax=Salimicrobium jeotgali TaxID=1230341 RepID=K2GLZ9_9BACI|nr:hypothetical protein [Salimicrobium jeotgali]AKG03295.1 hypothetical protein AAV35_013600 [Salimicrobium jeotgali]EKE31454.1 hypothetical protein MJ3_08005 [Salimicrobium jeotgali]MBM7696755.1 uncharacterized membrane protein HdeD (DUF308 family) [Salimicrobium jeotgali]
MTKENKMFWILGVIGTVNIIVSLILLLAINNTMISLMLFSSGVFLIIGGIADRKEKNRRRQRSL